MKYPLWLSLPLGCSVLWDAGGAWAASQTEPIPKLAVIAPTGSVGRVVLSGAKGSPYRLLFTADFQSWAETPAMTSDANGQASFPFATPTGRRFFRGASVVPVSSSPHSAAVNLGKRLFEETRFAQLFFAQAGSINSLLPNGGDPALDQISTLIGSVPGPFAGQSISCRSCHLTEELRQAGPVNRTFSDFAVRSPIPDRGDGRHLTVRNSPSLVNASLSRTVPFFLHFDGEFPNGRALVKGTLTGRNFGWLPSEHSEAVRHIARVIREDDGRAFLGPEFGGAYRRVLRGTDPDLPEFLRIPADLRMDVTVSTDEEILDRVAALVEGYLESLHFSTEPDGSYDSSPYDLFLRRNGLPRRPDPGENDLAYGRRLRTLLENLAKPAFVTPLDGSFTSLTQPFRFGSEELLGLKIFLAEPVLPVQTGRTAIGNCLVCHPPPHFTDFDFHNSGSTQWEYDSIHGEGAFSRIFVPGLEDRAAHAAEYLPPSALNPNSRGQFMAIPSAAQPGFVDLGVWNVYENPALPSSQPSLQSLLSARFGMTDPAALLPQTIGLFKTPGLRGLAGSAPYLHTGQASTLEAVLFFYRFTPELGRAQALRNGDPEMSRIFVGKADSPPLAAFLRSLNEDFPR